MNIWDRLTRVILFLFAAALVLLVVVWYTPVIQTNERMGREKLEIEKKITQEKKVAAHLDNQMKSLQDPRTVERLAREKLSYAKADEMVVHFETPPTNRTSFYR